MLLQRWEAKIRRQEKSPQSGIKLATTRSWVRQAHHWATRAGHGVKSSSVLCTIFCPSPLLHNHITIVKTIDSSERGMNPVAMTIINPLKICRPSWVSNQQPPGLFSSLVRCWLSYGAQVQIQRQSTARPYIFLEKDIGKILAFLFLYMYAFLCLRIFIVGQ